MEHIHIYAYQRIWAQCWGILLQLSGMTTDLARNLEHNEDIREKARRLEVVSKLPFKRDSNCRDVGWCRFFWLFHVYALRYVRILSWFLYTCLRFWWKEREWPGMLLSGMLMYFRKLSTLLVPELVWMSFNSISKVCTTSCSSRFQATRIMFNVRWIGFPDISILSLALHSLASSLAVSCAAEAHPYTCKPGTQEDASPCTTTSFAAPIYLEKRRSGFWCATRE